eukprot:4623802-Alexandrium_andersonii.AAC.1
MALVSLEQPPRIGMVLAAASVQPWLLMLLTGLAHRRRCSAASFACRSLVLQPAAAGCRGRWRATLRCRRLHLPVATPCRA